MPTYTLNAAFTNEDLKRFYATGTNVVMAKPSANGTPNVNWLVYRPLLANTVTWEENYGIYASTVPVTQAGAVLTQMSNSGIPATEGRLYKLDPAGVIAITPNPVTPGSYGLENDYVSPPGYMTVGLYQDAVANGADMSGNAISAAGTLYKSTAIMTPYTTIYIWMQSQVVSNSVTTTVTSPQTKVVFGGGVFTVSLTYNAATGTFIKDSSADVAVDVKDDTKIESIAAHL